MKKILVCQHVPYEILGTLDPQLRTAGFRVRYINFGREPNKKPSVKGYNGMIILGGPMNVDQSAAYPHLKHEITMIEEAISLDIPVLGICLGSQLIAKALGAKVKKNSCKEIGWFDVSPTTEAKKDPLLRHLKKTQKIFQWHGDTFDMPNGAAPLATGKTCTNQAFRYQDKVYGFQFHLEVDEPLITRWLSVEHHLKELAALKDGTTAEGIKTATSQHIGPSQKLSEQVFGSFIDLFGVKKTARLLKCR